MLRPAPDRGSMAVEFVLLAPAFILLMLLMAVGGRMVEAQGQVDGAARDAARAASVQTDGAQVGAAALAAAQSDLTQSGRNSCPGGVSVIPGAGGSAAGRVAVTVRCTINLAFFPGLGARTIHGSSVAPLDPYSYRNW